LQPQRRRGWAFGKWGCAMDAVCGETRLFAVASTLALQGFRIDSWFKENPFFTNVALAQV